MHEQVLSREVELRYIRTDRQVSDIFTKPLGSHKLQSFSKMLGLQHLDVLHLRERTRTGGIGKGTRKAAEEKEKEILID